jgi:hypothetical protein
VTYNSTLVVNLAPLAKVAGLFLRAGSRAEFRMLLILPGRMRSAGLFIRLS